MKYTVMELIKHYRTDNRIAYVFDGDKYLSDDYPDLVGLSPIVVSGSFQVDHDDEIFVFDLEVTCELTMLCALTLVEVKVPLSFKTTLTFALNQREDYMLQVDGLEIDLDPHVFAEILIEKPMKVVSASAREHYQEEIVNMDESEKLEASPFAKLTRKA